MSAEYSVEEVRAMANRIGLNSREEVVIEQMLTSHATLLERIKADEGAMVVAHRFLAPDGTAVTEWDDGMQDHGKAFPDLCPAIGSVQYAYDHPPAQAAQVERLENMLSDARTQLSQRDEYIAKLKTTATHPHSPDAADSGRVVSEPRFFIDHTMIHDRVTGKHVTCDPDFRDYEINPGETTRINNPDGISNTCALLNNLAALAAQGQGEPDPMDAIVQHCMVTEAVSPDSADPYGTISRIIDWHQANTAPPASPAGVPDGAT